MSEGGTRRFLRAGLTLIALLVFAVPLAPAARAADGGLVVIAETQYQVLPGEGRVHVTIDAVATSFEPDTAEGRVYYSGITFVVPAGASDVAASSGGAALPTRVVDQAAGFLAVQVDFSRRVFFRESYAYTVTFDLRDAGGEADRDVRIGRSLVAFPVWAFGTDDEPGGSVRVELPAGYQATVQGSAMERDRSPSGTVLSARPDDPFGFFAYVSADLPGAYTDRQLRVPLQNKRARIVVRAWDDDPQWSVRTSDLLAAGLPELEELIGVPYPHIGSLRVEEAAISRLGAYAGLYDPSEALIRVRYDADAFVTLHEAAHLWFNHRLMDDRWIGEAWAEFYSIEAGERIGAKGFRWELTRELRRSRIPLNDWGAVGREDLGVEDFAYAASYEVATLIADRASLEQLREVWRAAFAREPAYLPPDGREPVGRSRLGQPGWQRLLDLLEERIGESFDDIWAKWIVNEEQQRQLAARASARSRYEDVLEEAGDWQLPDLLRVVMSDWAFADARKELGLAERVLRERDRILVTAAAQELTPSDRLQLAFEGERALAAAVTLAELELDTLSALGGAADRLAGEETVLERIGLIGSQPQTALDEAREDYQAGRLGDAQRAARRAVVDRDEAADAGEDRVTLAAAAVLALDGLVLSALSIRRSRRRTAPVLLGA